MNSVRSRTGHRACRASPFTASASYCAVEIFETVEREPFWLTPLGMLKPEHRAVGIGAGLEPIIYYLADHIGRVTANERPDES